MRRLRQALALLGIASAIVVAAPAGAQADGLSGASSTVVHPTGWTWGGK